MADWIKQKWNGRQAQAQAQTQVNNQKQQIVETQTFIQQVDDAIQTVSLAAESFLSGINDKTVNLVSDGAIISLNMLAVSCDQLYKENDKDAIDLGKKRAEDKLNELKSKNAKVYAQIEPHRNFIYAALNGQRNLRIKSNRVKPAVKTLFESPDRVSKGWSTLIGYNQNFDQRQKEMYQPDLNKKLAKQQQSDLNEYRKSNKYGRNKSNKSSRSNSKRVTPNVKDFYHTKSGKSSKFVNTKAVEREQNDQKAMEEDIYAPEPDVYDELIKRPFMNAVLLLSPQNVWNDIDEPMPCLIEKQTKDQRARQNKKMVIIRPCFPNNNCTLTVPIQALELRIQEIKKIEHKYSKNLKKFSRNVPNPILGYQSIDEQASVDLDGDIDI